MTSPAPEELEVGYVRSAHGVRGAVKIQLHDRESVALALDAELIFRERGGGEVVHRARVEAWDPTPSKDGFRVSLEGVTDREAAEALKGRGVWVRRDELPPLEQDEYYLADAVGCRVRHAQVELALGVVEAVSSNGPQDLLAVLWRSPRGKKQRWLLPALPGYVVDLREDWVVADPPRGLMPDALEAALDEALRALETPRAASHAGRDGQGDPRGEGETP